MILGTAAYMAPEQAKGQGRRRRADIWAFGAVLFEMLTGTRAFGGDDVADTLANVMKTEPDWERLPADVPARMRQVLRACLQQDPKQRLGDIGRACASRSRARSRRPRRRRRHQPPHRRRADDCPGWSRLAAAVVGMVALAVPACGICAKRRHPRRPRRAWTSSRPPPTSPRTLPSRPTAGRSSSWPRATAPPASGGGRWRRRRPNRWRAPKARSLPSGRPTAAPSGSSPMAN